MAQQHLHSLMDKLPTVGNPRIPYIPGHGLTWPWISGTSPESWCNMAPLMYAYHLTAHNMWTYLLILNLGLPQICVNTISGTSCEVWIPSVVPAIPCFWNPPVMWETIPGSLFVICEHHLWIPTPLYVFLITPPLIPTYMHKYHLWNPIVMCE